MKKTPAGEENEMILIMESFKFSHAMLTVLCNFPHKTAKGKTTLMIGIF